MDYKIKGKLAFVTAGAWGIGQAIANLLIEEGAKVIVADQDQADLSENGRNWAGTFAADLTTAEGVDSAVAYVLKTFGKAPDILINNVGVADPNSLAEISD